MVVLLSTNANSFDLTSLKTIVSQACGVDLSTDKKDSTEAIRVLARLVDPMMRDDEAVMKSQRVQKHYTFSFIIAVPSDDSFNLVSVLETVRLSVIPCERNADLVIASGSLDKWRDLIINYSNTQVSSSVLKILNGLQTVIERYGLAEVFHAYQKKPARNGFHLEYHK